jgi:hypothetical protein
MRVQPMVPRLFRKRCHGKEASDQQEGDGHALEGSRCQGWEGYVVKDLRAFNVVFA